MRIPRGGGRARPLVVVVALGWIFAGLVVVVVVVGSSTTRRSVAAASGATARAPPCTQCAFLLPFHGNNNNNNKRKRQKLQSFSLHTTHGGGTYRHVPLLPRPEAPFRRTSSTLWSSSSSSASDANDETKSTETPTAKNSHPKEDLDEDATTTTTRSILDRIRSMKVRDLKTELDTLGIPTKDVFEKESLVQRLFQAKITAAKSNNSNNNNNTSTSSPQSNETPSSSTVASSTTTATTTRNYCITTPLYLTSYTEGMKIAAVNMPGGLTIDPRVQQTSFCTIQILVQQQQQSTRPPFQLSLLLDTACSGFVLRPSVVQKYGLPDLKSISSTMLGAGGTNGMAGVTNIESFTLVEQQQETKYVPRKSFGPLPAAVQEFGSLPPSLDGILGLSFLNQFEMVEFNLQRGLVLLYPHYNDSDNNENEKSSSSSSRTTQPVASADMTLLQPLGLYAVNVLLGGRGPVKLLVDTGASNTLLTWKGVASLGLSKEKNPNVIAPIQQMGAVGSDNVAIELTHRMHVSSTVNLQKSITTAKSSLSDSEPQVSPMPGLALAGKRIAIDIGYIPILEQQASLASAGIGGFLGMDILMRCASVQFCFKANKRGAAPSQITLFDFIRKNDNDNGNDNDDDVDRSKQ